jgi:hypothetical protein
MRFLTTSGRFGGELSEFAEKPTTRPNLQLL